MAVGLTCTDVTQRRAGRGQEKLIIADLCLRTHSSEVQIVFSKPCGDHTYFGPSRSAKQSSKDDARWSNPQVATQSSTLIVNSYPSLHNLLVTLAGLDSSLGLPLVKDSGGTQDQIGRSVFSAFGHCQPGDCWLSLSPHGPSSGGRLFQMPLYPLGQS